jgi:hypothetical protein
MVRSFLPGQGHRPSFHCFPEWTGLTLKVRSAWKAVAIILALSGDIHANHMPIEVRPALPADEAGALLAALDAGDRNSLDRLFAVGVSVETPLPSGETPLLEATRRRRPDLAAVCLDWCARTEAVGADGMTALTLAVVTRQNEWAARLVEAGADPNAALPASAPDLVLGAFDQPWFLTQLRHDPGLTPLMLASVLGEEDLVRVLIEHGGKPYQRTQRYTTDALTLACRAGQIRTAQRLLRRNPDDESGQKLEVVLGEQKATLFRGDEVVLTSKVSTGRKGYTTPTGEFVITSKHRDWTSTIYKAPMPYLLRLNASAIGLHQGAVPGYPASHGCIRLPAGKASAFFKTARIGDRVLIRH